MESLIRDFAPVAAMLSRREARAFLVGVDREGRLEHQRVGHTHSVLDLKTELLSHLSAQPLEEEFLERLRDYCAGRLAARAEAGQTGGVATHAGERRWEIVHTRPSPALRR